MTPAEAQALRARVRRALDIAPPRQAEAMRAGILRLAIHPRQTVAGSQWHYLELCASYVHTMGGWAYETARQAWRRLRSALGWWSVPAGSAEAMGAVLRPLKPGQRHGSHILLRPEITAHMRELAEDLGILEDTPDDLLSWREVKAIRRGARVVARCPFHDDTRPSMLLDTARRRATCLACGTVHRLDPTRWLVSDPVERRPNKLTQRPSTTGYPSCAPAPDRWVLADLTPGGLRWLVEGGDLFDALEASDRRAARQRPPVMAHACGDHRRTAPERLASLDQLEATGWRQVRGRWIATGQRVVAVRYIAVDVDGIHLHPLEEDAIEPVGPALEAFASSHPELSGRVAVTRTSLRGVQAIFELSEAQEPAWRAWPEAAALHDAADAATLAALEAAGFLEGHADPSARLGGRYIRRPGPRLGRMGEARVVRLAHLTPPEAAWLTRPTSRAPQPQAQPSAA